MGNNHESFFFTQKNDNQIYHVNFKEIPQILELDELDMIVTYQVQSYSCVFYHHQNDSNKVYKITCEKVSHALIVEYLNKSIHGIEFKQNEQHKEYLKFSNEQRKNLEYNLKQYLFNYLTPKVIEKSNMINKL
ncbi:4994_t:CDS:1 [Funneliformis geosporum]|uniref:10314_t:CDS:1 n=1 Tax=Funneliformis geosporum TaxID=1117311 RepID=A0A9W4SWI6_9GLOM|nr:10314_t:CDS:1 [Funneliformis geosporum]CAI2184366.1 4994_t:CDS:1 [Funneliformis geosporum]